MVTDLEAGAVIPPIVIGIHGTSSETKSLFAGENGDQFFKYLNAIDSERISIIDGMQRTTALLEAVARGGDIQNDSLRVEFWISASLNSLIYRMLVLNTGQVPWEIARQLETVYSQLLTIIKGEIGDAVEVFSRDDQRRRSEPGQYQASAIVRLFLAFSSRRAEFDLRDRVAEDFARLDAVEASSHHEFLRLFIRAMRLAAELDRAFARAPHASKQGATRIADGQEIFQSFPALVGFFVAVAIKLFDQPGFDVDWSKVESKMENVEGSVLRLTERLNGMPAEDVQEFLQLDLLNDRLAQRSGQVGRFERDLFIRAFNSMLDNADRLPDMMPCCCL